IDRETPKDKELHLICDNYATHKHPVVQEWLGKHPRLNMHFTPTSASWLNIVERFFRDITHKPIPRHAFTSLPDAQSQPHMHPHLELMSVANVEPSSSARGHERTKQNSSPH